MTRVVVLSACALAAGLMVVGCGPVTRTLPERLNADQQKEVDAAWEKALAPVGQHDRQTWLDVFVVSQAYQVGVDELDFRSVKSWSGGRVVMEIRIDRAKPDADRFAVTVLDHGGAVLRREAYNRAEVEKAFSELQAANRPPEPGSLEAATYEARLKRIEAVLPKPADKP